MLYQNHYGKPWRQRLVRTPASLCTELSVTATVCFVPCHLRWHAVRNNMHWCGHTLLTTWWMRMSVVPWSNCLSAEKDQTATFTTILSIWKRSGSGGRPRDSSSSPSVQLLNNLLFQIFINWKFLSAAILTSLHYDGQLQQHLSASIYLPHQQLWISLRNCYCHTTNNWQWTVNYMLYGTIVALFFVILSQSHCINYRLQHSGLIDSMVKILTCSHVN